MRSKHPTESSLKILVIDVETKKKKNKAQTTHFIISSREKTELNRECDD